MTARNSPFNRIVLVRNVAFAIEYSEVVHMHFINRILKRIAEMIYLLVDTNSGPEDLAQFTEKRIEDGDLVIVDLTLPENGKMRIPHWIAEWNNNLRLKNASLIVLCDVPERDGCHVLMVNDHGIESVRIVKDDAFSNTDSPQKSSFRAGSAAQKEIILRHLETGHLVLIKDWPQIIEAIDIELRERAERADKLEEQLAASHTVA